jgi:hypothetical protein
MPVCCVLCGQCLVVDDQQVLGTLLLRRLGEIEAARDGDLPINNHHLMMRNGMVGVNLARVRSALGEA